MAIDTVWKRASATVSYPQAMLVWPSGAVDRQAASWLYVGPWASAPALVMVETLAAISEITKTIAAWSYLMPTLAKDSTITTAVVENSKI